MKKVLSHYLAWLSSWAVVQQSLRDAQAVETTTIDFGSTDLQQGEMVDSMMMSGSVSPLP